MGIKGLESLILTNNDKDNNKTRSSVVKKKLIFLINTLLCFNNETYNR